MQADTSLSQGRKCKKYSEIARGKKLMMVWPLANTLCVKVNGSQEGVNINALGAEKGLRRMQDGRTYFGTRRKAIKGDPSSSTLNDILLPLPDSTQRDLHRGRHFLIEYDPFKEAYFAQDLHCGFGLFLRLASPMPIRDNVLLHIGTSCILASGMYMKSVGSTVRLKIKVFGGANSSQIYLFSQGDRVRVGRHPECEIVLEDMELSKVQCMFHWEQGWWLGDGDIDRPSKNGTWVYASDPCELHSGSLLRAGPWELAVHLCS